MTDEIPKAGDVNITGGAANEFGSGAPVNITGGAANEFGPGAPVNIVAGSYVNIVAADGKAETPNLPSKGKWYYENEPRPDRFCFGPVTGNMKSLDYAVGGQRGDRNGRVLKGKGQRGTIWVVRRQRTAYEIWFTSQPDFDSASRRLAAE